MLPAVLLLAVVSAPADVSRWIPARWYSHDPASLELITETPVNCLLLDQRDWTEPFAAAAQRDGIATLGVIRTSADALAAARKAAAAGMSGVVLEGDFADAARAAIEHSGILTIELPSRARLRLDDPRLRVLGTNQGVWPGVQIQKNGTAVSAPSGAPWIDTNAGFLRYVHAQRPEPVWIAYAPPDGLAVSPARYVQAVADAESSGAHWVITLDEETQHGLAAGKPAAVECWSRIAETLRFYAEHPEWRQMRPDSTLAVLEDAGSGAFLSGGILDMLVTKHTTVLPIASSHLDTGALTGAKMAVAVDPASLTAQQQSLLKAYARAGNTLLTGPPGWKMPAPADSSQIVLDKEQIARLDEIWKELTSLINSRNPGVKVFNAPGAISNAVEAPGGRTVVLQFVNYTDYPIESITVHLNGAYHSAKLLAPGKAPTAIDLFEQDNGTGMFIDSIGGVAAVVLE